jgi:hypothetical protein
MFKHLILGCVLLLSACDVHEPPYRYPCQNPENWKTDYCQKPMCEVHRECPELIFKNFNEMGEK